jgi:hypothetical protein
MKPTQVAVLLLAISAPLLLQAQPVPPAGPGRPRPHPSDHQHDAQGNDLPKNSVTIELKDGVRTIKSNGIPDHDPGKFPNPNNPNTISAQSYTLRMPEKPKPLEKPRDVGHLLFGVALNGVVFDPGTAEFWKDDPRSGWRMEAIAPAGVKTRNLGLDTNNAHVQPTGAYHYHASPTGLVTHIAATKGLKPQEAMILVGWAADGYPIYNANGSTDAKGPVRKLHSSYRLKPGDRPENSPAGKCDGTYTQDWEFVPGGGDLDECNGRTGVTPEFPGGTYYYVLTDEFPYIPRLFHGQPDESFAHMGPPPGRRGPGGPPDGREGPRSPRADR